MFYSEERSEESQGGGIVVFSVPQAEARGIGYAFNMRLFSRELVDVKLQFMHVILSGKGAVNYVWWTVSRM
ncbi:MAG: hypothetical protein Q7R34_03020 [Dehalococcoidia bacterium]|nr:hypothetical protein [Dehalococcoidia bacterium]